MESLECEKVGEAFLKDGGRGADDVGAARCLDRKWRLEEEGLGTKFRRLGKLTGIAILIDRRAWKLGIMEAWMYSVGFKNARFEGVRFSCLMTEFLAQSFAELPP